MEGKIYISSFCDYNKKIIHEKYKGDWNYENYIIKKKVSLFKNIIFNLASDLEELFLFSESTKNSFSFVEGTKSTEQGFNQMMKFGSHSIVGAMVAGSIIKKRTTNRINQSLYFNAKLKNNIIFSATTIPEIYEELTSLQSVTVWDNRNDELTKKNDKLLLSPKDGWIIK